MKTVDVLTSHNVSIEYEAASVMNRGVASFLDLLIMGAYFLLVSFISAAMGISSMDLNLMTIVLYIFLLPVPDAGIVAWMVTVVVARELVITGLRSFMESYGATFGADWLGKIKMVLQCAALIAIFLFLQAQETWLGVAKDVLIYAMLLATALSGLQYLWRAFAVLKMEG